MKTWGVVGLLGLVGCASPTPAPTPAIALTPVEAPVSPAPTSQTSAAPPTASASAKTTPPATSLEEDPCVFTEIDLASLPERCRCHVDDRLRLAGDDAPAPRQACDPKSGVEGTSHLRVTGAAGGPSAGGGVGVSIVVENTAAFPVAVQFSDPWRDSHPILVGAKDATGTPVDRPAGRCDGPGSRVEGVLRDIRTFRAIVLPPGGKARHSTVWSAQRAVYFRDVVSSNQLVVMSRAMEPCRIVGDGSLGPGRYSLNYDIGLMVERGLVPVDVDVP